MNFITGRIKIIYVADCSSSASKAGVKKREVNPDTLTVENSH